MVVKVKLSGRYVKEVEVSIKGSVKVKELLKLLDLNTEDSDYLVIRSGEALNEDSIVNDGDEVTIVEVPMGG